MKTNMIQRPPKPAAEAGFSLIELLIVTVVLGIIMAITIVTLANALDKARQGATIADMRNLATAIEAYQVDHSNTPLQNDWDVVAIVLRPYHNQIVPINDHWGFMYHYETSALGYTLRSYGKDGVSGAILGRESRNDFNRDIVYSNGQFAGLPQ